MMLPNHRRFLWFVLIGLGLCSPEEEDECLYRLPSRSNEELQTNETLYIHYLLEQGASYSVDPNLVFARLVGQEPQAQFSDTAAAAAAADIWAVLFSQYFAMVKFTNLPNVKRTPSTTH
jgi:hypothetical protein